MSTVEDSNPSQWKSQLTRLTVVALLSLIVVLTWMGGVWAKRSVLTLVRSNNVRHPATQTPSSTPSSSLSVSLPPSGFTPTQTTTIPEGQVHIGFDDVP